MLSIIIPSRNADYLQKTVDDLLKKAEGEIEIIIVLDGYWPKEYNWSDNRIKIVHHGTIHNSRGMREGINSGVAIAKGEYLMKTDEHCMFDQGYDVKLIADCEDNWVVIPRRYRLDAENWTIIEDGRPPIDYMHVDYPFQRPFDKTCGLHGGEWKQRYYERKEILIDDTPSMQGSCWFMSKKHWDNVIKRMEDENYGTFTQESQEICHKTWLSGGRVVVNKKTWYAHYHKGHKGKGYGFSNAQYKEHMAGTEKGRLFCIDFWLNDRWDKRIHDWEWFVNEKFPDMPGWGKDWKERIEKDKAFDYSKK